MDIGDNPAILDLRSETGRCIVVGTSHISDVSPQLVARVIRAYRPDAVAVELDLERAKELRLVADAKQALADPECAAAGTAVAVDSSGLAVQVVYPTSSIYPGALPLAVQGLLAVTFGSLAHVLGDERAEGKQGSYGQEFVVAAAQASQCLTPDGSPTQLILIDRELSLTFARMGSSLGLRDLVDALPSALAGVHLYPGYHPPLRYVGKLVWHGLWGDWQMVGRVGRDIVEHSEESMPEVASGNALAKQISAFNLLLLPIVESGRIPTRTPADTRNYRQALSTAFTSVLSSLDGDALDSFQDDMPAALTSERDTLLAWALKKCTSEPLARSDGNRRRKERVVVGVVGRGHLPGIAREWESLHPARPPTALLHPPPGHTALSQGAPLLAAGAYILAVGQAWRKGSRALAMAGVGVAVTTIATGGLLGYRVVQGCTRIGAALRNKGE